MNAVDREQLDALAVAGLPVPPPDDESRAEQDLREYIEMREYFERYPNRLKSISDILASPCIDWLVPDRLHRSGLAQLYGPSYSGKTLLALDLALSVAAGLETWLELPLNVDGPQAVIYVAAEGGAPFAVHVDAWMKAHPGADLSGLRVLDGGEGHHVNLTVSADPRDQVPHEYDWPRFAREIADARLRPALVVFDTQVDLAPAVDENSNREMVEVLRQVKSQADKQGYLALVVHHTGHQAGRARGASGQKAKSDVQMSAAPSGSGRGFLEWGKVKGAALPEDKVGYAITPVDGSEGAVVTRLTAVATAAAINAGNGVDASVVAKVLEAVRSGSKSARSIAEAAGLHRDTEVKPALKQLEADDKVANAGSPQRPSWVVV